MKHCKFRLLASAVAAALLQACSTPPPPKPPAAPLPPVKFDAVLLPGCLMLTSPEVPADSGTATLQLRVAASGQVVSARVTKSSGSQPTDAMLQASARRCAFSPAFTSGGANHERTEVEDDYTLNVSWPKPPLLGPHRCFRPDYTLAARRRDEEGTVVVEFRLRVEDGTLETRVGPTSTAIPMLRELSVRTVQACLRHEEASGSLQRGVWYAIPYTWRLE